MILHKIVPQDLIRQKSDESQPMPHFAVIILMIVALGVPTVCWVKQINAALNQPNNPVNLENYSETGEMF